LILDLITLNIGNPTTSITIIGCQFNEGGAHVSGGGIAYEGSNASALNLLLNKVVFWDNFVTTGSGGGLHLNLLAANNNIRIQSSIFSQSGADAGTGGGLNLLTALPVTFFCQSKFITIKQKRVHHLALKIQLFIKTWRWMEVAYGLTTNRWTCRYLIAVSSSSLPTSLSLNLLELASPLYGQR